MRGGLVFLILLAACRPPSSPDYIKDLLSQTPIPLDKLTEVLCLRQGDLQLVGGPAPEVLDYPSAPLWKLRNVSGRDLWIYRKELAAWLSIQPLVPIPPGCGGGIHLAPPERPSFALSEWIRLAPGQSVPILIPAPWSFGQASICCNPGGVAENLIWRAHSFNQGALTSLPGPLPARDSFSLGTSWILPSFVDEHRAIQGDDFLAGLPLEMTSSPDVTLRWTSDLPTIFERPDPLRIRAWILSLDRALAFQGDLVAVRHETRRLAPSNQLHVETDYRIPRMPASGAYRILLVAPRMGIYVSTLDREQEMLWRQGISTWIPLQIP